MNNDSSASATHDADRYLYRGVSIERDLHFPEMTISQLENVTNAHELKVTT